ncbi:hypothetical protein [Halalkalibacillus halophilus]|uniref:hypothetical protein n=1 Tax=Halalkalibacillus halophilus TaxID=392827 RepID=UPI0003FBA8C6|nr:hypothetical protein [Halalkalibacillus halophilus]
MEQSWISKFLPDDEYKERKIVYFIAESAVILAVMLFVFVLINNYSLYGNSTTGMVALLALFFLITYILIRYILSGIEYTEVTDDKKYKKEKNVIRNRSIVSFVLILVLFFVFNGLPSNLVETIDFTGQAFLIALFMFVINYVSLKKSLKKNRELIDD